MNIMSPETPVYLIRLAHFDDTISMHPDVSELLNLQDVRGEAKPYQVRQFLRLVERHDLRLGERE